MVEPLFHMVDCARLSVTSLAAGLAFYRDRLGLELIWRTPEAVGLRLPDDKTEIVLHTEPRAPEIDLKVASADDAAVQIVKAGGESGRPAVRHSDRALRGRARSVGQCACAVGYDQRVVGDGRRGQRDR